MTDYLVYDVFTQEAFGGNPLAIVPDASDLPEAQLQKIAREFNFSETTFVTPSENFFRFNMDGAQWSAGLGEYVFKEKGYKTVATIGEDYSFIYTQVFGFALEFCGAGGQITEPREQFLGVFDLFVAEAAHDALRSAVSSSTSLNLIDSPHPQASETFGLRNLNPLSRSEVS